MRNDQREWIIGYAKLIRMETVEMAEAWSLQIGLEIASSLNVKKIEVEMDYEEIYKLLTQNFNDLHPIAIIISNCRLLLSYLWRDQNIKDLNETEYMHGQISKGSKEETHTA